MLEDKIKLKEGEEIIVIERPNWKFYILKILNFFLLSLIPAFFFFFLVEEGFYGFLIIFSIIFLAILYGAHSLTVYYYNVYIITNLRIIGIEQKGFFKRVIMAIDMKNIAKANLFKKKSLHLELENGKDLILDHIEDRDYIYETVKNIIDFRKTEHRKVDFVRKKI